MANLISNTFKVLFLAFFFINLLLIVPNIDPALLNVTQLIGIFDLIIKVFSDIVIALATIVASIATSFLGRDVFQVAVTQFPKLIKGVFPTVAAADLPADIIGELVLSLGVLITLILLPMMILSAVGFVIRGETRLSIYSYIAFILLLTLAVYTNNLNNIDLSIPESGNFIAFLTAPIFVIALMLYLMLEFSFQVAYTLNIMEPMRNRESRIKQHLARVRSYVPKATAMAEEESTTRVSSQQSKKFGVLAASYLRELVEKKVFKKGETELSDKAMMRLQSYVDSLERMDDKFDDKITAKSAQPEANRILKQLIPTMVFRFTFIVFLSLFIMDPLPLLEFIQGLGIIYFPQLLDSLELTQPEFSTLVVFNVVLIVILISSIFSYLNKRLPEIEPETQKIDTLVKFSEEGLDDLGISSSESDVYDEYETDYVED